MDRVTRFFDDQLSNEGIISLKNSPPSRCFAVISWGCTATSWLAKTLDAHPDIFCVHNLNSVWNTLGFGERLDGLAYLRLLASYGYAYAAVGDVHGVSRHHVPALREKLGDMFEAIVLIREPLARLKSQIALFEQCSFKGWGALEHVDAIVSDLGMDPADLSSKQRHFIHAAGMLNTIFEEQGIGNFYRYEDFTTDANVLARMADQLLGRSDFDPKNADWAKFALKIEPVNMHKSKQHDFSDWEQEILNKVVKPAAWTIFESKFWYNKPAFIN